MVYNNAAEIYLRAIVLEQDDFSFIPHRIQTAEKKPSNALFYTGERLGPWCVSKV